MKSDSLRFKAAYCLYISSYQECTSVTLLTRLKISSHKVKNVWLFSMFLRVTISGWSVNGWDYFCYYFRFLAVIMSSATHHYGQLVSYGNKTSSLVKEGEVVCMVHYLTLMSLNYLFLYFLLIELLPSLYVENSVALQPLITERKIDGQTWFT